MSVEINRRLDSIDRLMQQFRTLHSEIRRLATGHPEPWFVGPANEIDHTTMSTWELHVVFTEAVTGFEASDVLLVNGTVGLIGFGNGYEYTLDITPEEDFTGNFWVTIPADVAQDSQGNGNTAGHFHVPIV